MTRVSEGIIDVKTRKVAVQRERSAFSSTDQQTRST